MNWLPSAGAITRCCHFNKNILKAGRNRDGRVETSRIICKCWRVANGKNVDLMLTPQLELYWPNKGGGESGREGPGLSGRGLPMPRGGQQLADVLGQGNKSNACVHSSLYFVCSPCRWAGNLPETGGYHRRFFFDGRRARDERERVGCRGIPSTG